MGFMNKKRSVWLSVGTRVRVTVVVALLCVGVLANDGPVQRGGSAPETEPDHPNVLIVMWDAVRADRLSAYGYARPTTPFLEEFAKEAALYENAVSPGIGTLAAHASLFTGLPVTTHGLTTYHKWLNDDFTTLAERFSAGGYRTYFFSANIHIASISNLPQGFDKKEHSWDGMWRYKVEQSTREKLDPSDDSNLMSRRLNTPGPKHRVNPTRRVDLKEAGPVVTEALEAWLDEHNSDKPFFAFLNLMEAYQPRIPSRSAREKMMSPDQIKASYRVDQSHLRQMEHTFGLKRYSDDEIKVISGVYDASLVDLDASTRQVTDMLRRRGLLDGTVVVIVSDHGEYLGEHGLLGHMYRVYNQVTRVPLVIRYPPRVKAGRIAEPVSVLDLYATLLDLAGLEPPQANPHSISLFADSSVRSRSRPIVTEAMGPGTNALFRATRYYSDLDWIPWLRSSRAIELGGMKYIQSSDGRHELFDLVADPGETNNLFETSSKRVRRLESALDEWIGTVKVYDHYQPRQRKAPLFQPLMIRELPPGEKFRHDHSAENKQSHR